MTDNFTFDSMNHIVYNIDFFINLAPSCKTPFARGLNSHAPYFADPQPVTILNVQGAPAGVMLF